MPKLTALIPCKDEAHNIADCIASVRKVADEILVADSGSTDGTLEIVRNQGDCRLIEREYINSANFKNWAIPQASHPWVLVCDADERLDSTMVEEIRELMRSEPPCDGYRMRSTTFFLGLPIRYSGRNTNTKLQLFRKDIGRYETRRVHADVVMDKSRVGLLDGKLLHYHCQCLNRYAQTMNRYSTWSALDMYEKGRRVTWMGVFLRPLARFIQFYILRRGILDGMGGFLICMFTAYYNFLKYAKLWELEHSQTVAMRSPEKASDNCTTDLSDYQPTTPKRAGTNGSVVVPNAKGNRSMAPAA